MCDVPSAVHESSLPGYLLYIAGNAEFKSQLKIEVILQFLDDYRRRQDALDSDTQQLVEAYVYLGQLGKAREVLQKASQAAEDVCHFCNATIVGEFSLMSCGHLFHPVCIESYVSQQVVDLRVKCPICQTAFSTDEVMALSPKIRQLYEDRLFALQVNEGSHSLQCPNCNMNNIGAAYGTVQCQFCLNEICASCCKLMHQCSCQSPSAHACCPGCKKQVLNPEKRRILNCHSCNTLMCAGCTKFIQKCQCRIK